MVGAGEKWDKKIQGGGKRKGCHVCLRGDAIYFIDFCSNNTRELYYIYCPLSYTEDY